jgi:hypothetical protein
MPREAPALLALDLRTGRVLWRDTQRVFGTWLGYSAEHDALLQAGRPSRDMLGDETGRHMTAFRGRDGTVLWDRPELEYSGPPLLNGPTLYAQGAAYELMSGRRVMRTDPLTGRRTPWRMHRCWGCDSFIGSTHLLTFRSGAAAFFDVTRDGGTGNLGGFRSGCTSNLIAADGVLSAADYTRGCTCSYQNQTSLALVHMPEGHAWTYLWAGSNPRGINFGAPGGRRAPDGTAWGPWPVVKLARIAGGVAPRPDPDFAVTVEFDERFGYWSDHPSRYQAPRGPDGSPAGLTWVACSGIRGVRKIVLPLATGRRRNWTVRLHFAEPDEIPPGRRVFDVKLAGRTVLKGFDIVKAAGGVRRAVVKTFHSIPATGQIVLHFAPKSPVPLDPTRVPLLCGIEAALAE